MAIIALNSYSGAGKDTVGCIIQYLLSDSVGNITVEEAVTNYDEHEWWLEENSEWETRKFAGKLKDIASHLTGIDIEKFEDQEFKKTLLGPEWGRIVKTPLNNIPVFEDVQFNSLMSVRDFLQALGTDSLRNNLHPNVWVNALMADYRPIEYNDDEQPRLPNWIITDCRFPNEAQAVKDKGGLVIRIDRPGVKPINDHPSEVALDNWKFDYKIANVSDIYALKETVEVILKHAKIIR
jgi:hypothetical protein